MTVCKYFLEGRCRFGDRCRFEHVAGGGRYDSYYEPRYDSPNRYSRDNSYDYHEQYDRNRPQQRYTNQQNPYSWQSPSYNASNYNSYQHDNRRSRYDDFTSGVSHSQTNYGVDNQRNYGTKSSTYQSTVGKSNYSSGVNSERDKENIGPDVETVREDAVAWEIGQQWPFSCYYPFKGHPAFPGFEDTSPEELRYKAYEAEKNNTFTSYVNSVSEALENVNKKWELLKRSDANVKNIVKQLRAEKLDLKTDNVCKQLLFHDMGGAGDASQGSPPSGSFFSSGTPFGAASNFSFKRALKDPEPTAMHNVSVDSFTAAKSNTDTLSSFSFTLPSSQPGKLVDGDMAKSSLYTPVDKLNKEELDAFAAPTFTLGKIPTRPPAREMCF